VQELEARDYFGAIESGPLLGKASALLDVEHEITAIQILHHEEQVALQDIEDIENIAILWFENRRETYSERLKLKLRLRDRPPKS